MSAGESVRPLVPLPPPPADLITSAAIVLGAGSGSRVGAERNKVLLEVAGRPILAHSVRTALAVPGVVQVVLVVRPGEESEVSAALAPHLGPDDEVLMVTGGATRHASETRALQALSASRTEADPPLQVIAIHDGARPMASAALWESTIRAAAVSGGALPVREVTGLVRRIDASRVPVLGAVQTPQAFRADVLVGAYRAAAAEGFEGTDTASCVERYSPDLRIAAVRGPEQNIKVTFPDDVALADRLLR